jgi:hypothetical protein
MTSTRVAADPIAKARIVLLTNHPYYGSLALRLIVEPDESIPTACTDGLHLFYNPQFTDKLTLNQRVFVFAHEANHCAKLHIVRRQMRDMELWNCAADFQINLELKQDGFDVIPGSLIDPRFAGMAVEQIYAILDKEEKAGKWKRPQMQWNFGGFIDAPKDAKTADGKDVRDLETEWKVAVQTAAIQAKESRKAAVECRTHPEAHQGIESGLARRDPALHRDGRGFLLVETESQASGLHPPGCDQNAAVLACDCGRYLGLHDGHARSDGRGVECDPGRNRAVAAARVDHLLGCEGAARG